MRFLRIFAASLALVALVGTTSAAPRDPIVGGAPMSAKKDIVENASASKDHTTLVKLVKAGGLVDTLASPGPFTVFAPTNQAFAKLPPGAVDNLTRPENKAQLQTVLTYHVVSGTFTSKDLAEKVKEGGGKAQLKTVQGEPLTIEKRGRTFEVVDAKGSTAIVTIPNVLQSNGIIHVIDAVLLP